MYSIILYTRYGTHFVWEAPRCDRMTHSLVPYFKNESNACKRNRKHRTNPIKKERIDERIYKRLRRAKLVDIIIDQKIGN